MKQLQTNLKTKLKDILKKKYNLTIGGIEFSIPPQRKFGDLSTNLPFILAKEIKQAPVKIGQEIANDLKDGFDFLKNTIVAGGGFLNFYFDNNRLFKYLLHNRNNTPPQKNEKVIVEHTSINPNKAAHIGHLRNSILGDTLVQTLSHLGYQVEVQNYIDDTGIQVTDVIWGLLKYKKMSFKEIKKIDNLASFLWGLYAEVSTKLAGDEASKIERDEIHQRIEEGMEPEYGICKYVSEGVLKDHIQVMKDLNIFYDLLVKESDIIKLGFFGDVKKILEEKGILYSSKDPEKKGCLVINYHKGDSEKVIVRSNQTLTYIAKDLAYAFWKMGLIHRDFFYHQFHTYPNGRKIFATDFIIPPSGKGEAHQFGGGYKVYNVIGIRQAYLQDIISQVINTLSKEDRQYIHFFYEMVSLSPQCIDLMVISIKDADKGKKSIDVSGRKGIAIEAKHLMKELLLQAQKEVKDRNKDLSKEETDRTARVIAIGALRYFMIKYNSTSPITFDFKEALSFEGNSGPYIQYSVVRINSILKKLHLGEEELYTEFQLAVDLLPEPEQDHMSEILLLLSRIELEAELSIKNRDLSAIASYTYKIAQKINHYYHLYPVISEKNQGVKETRALFLVYAKEKLTLLASLLGIAIPDRM